MILKKQLTNLKQLQPKLKTLTPLNTWLTVFGIFSLVACTTPSLGPEITGCVFDYARNGFDCYSDENKETFLPMESAKDIECMTATNFEAFLKACKKGILIAVDTCKPNLTSKGFDCKDSKGVPSTFIYFDSAPKLFCYTTTDADRIVDRCKLP